MAYDRYENRGDNRGRWRDDDERRRGPRGDDDGDRGFFERAADEVRSWFGDEDDDRHPDNRRGPPGASYGARGYPDEGRHADAQRGSHRDRSSAMFSGGQSSRMDRDRPQEYGGGYRGSGESGGFGRGGQDRYGPPPSRSGFGGRDQDRYGSRFDRDDDYRPMTGDYGRGGERSYRSGMGGQDFSRSQYGRQEFSQDQDRDRNRGVGQGSRYAIGGWGDEDSQRSSHSHSFGGHPTDPHYSEWRQRQMSELDRDYDEYRREHQSKFESEFHGWRQQRQTKRQMLQSIREDMEVLGSDQQRIGTVDKVRGDKVILNRKDPEAGGVHRSFTCSLLEQVEGDKVILSQPAEQVRQQLQREEDHERSSGGIMSGLFGGSRDDDRDSGSDRDEGRTDLNRSFSGTYERKPEQS
ncbi:DUF2171 domain-containing protein [Sphingomonas sp. GCM10030256]|uniref:DUF2171 domain-containing protein n=1 Tax=Sphingomonas sp. GCM10030256 TaxID=3273427 RepID=UPI00361600EB